MRFFSEDEQNLPALEKDGKIAAIEAALETYVGKTRQCRQFTTLIGRIQCGRVGLGHTRQKEADGGFVDIGRLKYRSEHRQSVSAV